MGAPDVPATRVEVCSACGGLRNSVQYATEHATCGNAAFEGKAHLHRSCTTCGYRTCEPLADGGQIVLVEEARAAEAAAVEQAAVVEAAPA